LSRRTFSRSIVLGPLTSHFSSAISASSLAIYRVR
jgi:hypothetical protein